MHRKLYTHLERKNWWVVIAIIILLVGLNGFVIFKLEPANIFIEILGLFLFGVLWVMIVAWITGRTKWGFVITGALMYVLIMNRIGWLSWPSLGVGMIGFGLISLMN